MGKSAEYILSAYSLIFTYPLDKLLEVGYLSKDGNPIPSFDENLLIDLCSEAQEIFEKENNTIEIEGDTIIVGDIHGSLHDLLRILKYIQENESKVLFLGDYVDRGNFSLECITILFALKVMQPDSFFLIRGNHEFDTICSQYGFKDEIINYHNPKKHLVTSIQQQIQKLRKAQPLNGQPPPNKDKRDKQTEDNDFYYDKNCYKYSDNLYQAFVKTFSYLPIASIINGTTFCIHGGLSPKLEHIDNLNKMIIRPVINFEDNLLLSDIVWSDPSGILMYPFDENPRGRGYLFNRESVTNFLKNCSLTRMVRAHQCVQDGSQKNFGDKCITVFSASSYDSYLGNSSAILHLSQRKDTLNTITFQPIERLEKTEAAYYKVQSYNTSNDKILFCFSLLHPGYDSSLVPQRRARSKGKKRITTQKSVVYSGSPIGNRSLMKTKFITNPRRSYQFGSHKPRTDVLNEEKNENS